jgi:L-alanine-DL-glutamate epimerase-like enolase superfamily enzyme
MRQPFVTTLGSKTVSKNLGVEVTLDSGAKGWAEASASLAMPAETQSAMTKWFKTRRGHHPTALGALECAQLLAYAAEKNIPVRRFFGPNNKHVETDFTLSAWDLATTVKVAQHYYNKGFRRFKVKVGKQPLEGDLQRLDALHKRFGNIVFWIDANQGFTVADVEHLVKTAQSRGWRVAAIEQPTPKKNLRAMALAQRISPYPIYADESAASLNDVRQIIRRKAAKGIVIKIAKTGLAEAHAIVRLARKHKLRTMISCMAETARGLTTSVQWAIGDGRFDWVDLDSFLLTGTKPPRGSFRATGPWLS